METHLILASASPFRRQLLENAGLDFESVPAEIDERAAEAPLAEGGVSPSDIALVLAEAKAIAVSEARPEAIVIGCDQTLSLDESMKEWGALKTGPELPVDQHEELFEAYRQSRMRWVYAGLILSALSLVGAAAVAMIPNSPSPT